MVARAIRNCYLISILKLRNKKNRDNKYGKENQEKPQIRIAQTSDCAKTSPYSIN